MREIPYETGSYYIFDRAYNKFSQLYSIHQIDAYFVVRAKKNLQYKAIKWRRKLPQNVLSDSTIELTTYKSSKDYPKSLRLARYYDAEQSREFAFLTNAMHISSLMVAELYKNRWQIELFFKWLKQHLKIKKFWGDYGERCEDTNLCCHQHLSLGFNRKTRHAIGAKHLRSLADFEHFTN